MRYKKMIMAILLLICILNMSLLLSSNKVSSAKAVCPPGEAIAIRPVDQKVSAGGAVELVSKRPIVMAVEGNISQVAVKIGDTVSQGDLLFSLDTTELERAAARSQIDFETAQTELEKLNQGNNPSEITVAEANLRAAHENLAKVQAGATAEELEVARKNLAAAQAKLTELQSGPSSTSINEAEAELDKAKAVLNRATHAYNAVKTDPKIGMLPESQVLWEATADYNRADAKYKGLWNPPSKSDLQSAESNIQKAENELKQLEQKPTSAELAEAQAKAVEAEERLTRLKAGPSATDLYTTELKVKKAQLDLEDARTKLQNAHVTAPIVGTVLDIKAVPGDRVSVGTVVMTLGDTTQLKLTVQVAEIDVIKISLHQPVSITIDAIPNHTFQGVVEDIAPINKADKDVTNYPVTIRLQDIGLESVRPGMNALAELIYGDPSVNIWQVPLTSILDRNGQSLVCVARGEVYIPIAVIRGEKQGDWTEIQSLELKNADKVLGELKSYLEDQIVTVE